VSVTLDDPVTGVTGALQSIHVQLDALLGADLSSLDREALLEVARESDRARRRLAAAGHALVAELDNRGVAYELGCKNTAALLRQLLRLSPSEAAGRVRAATLLTDQHTPSGAITAARYPLVAAAHADGDLSPEHARVITTTIEALPDEVADTHGELLEAAFVAEARELDPVLLARRARHVLERLDPDGVLHDTAHRNRSRDLSVRTRPDGSARVEIEASAELAELFDVVFDSLAAPRAAADGIKDHRTPGQRRHDALRDGLKILLQTGELPHAGGVPAQLLLTISSEAYLSGAGLAETSHGRLIPTHDALDWAGGDPRVLLVALTKLREVSHYTGTQRSFTPQQRKAMIARDRGCTAPGCDAPPGRCDAHHVTDYAKSGTTTIADGALACTWCHRELINQGWTTTMIDGRPHWIPPVWIDPEQQPRRNTTFDLSE
jgi:hypothetical protein